ncbi:hypothetical protein [Streptomyces stelliscabiei]|uniref:hypothetical protein n=1 Tax=Streptomyces stelliscabiei TaxID=146820 RepID=UPI003A9542A7
MWTSGAQFADYGCCSPARSGTSSNRRAITAFLVPMDAPGVDVRPIRQMSGGAPSTRSSSAVSASRTGSASGAGAGLGGPPTTLGFERTPPAAAAGAREAPSPTSSPSPARSAAPTTRWSASASPTCTSATSCAPPPWDRVARTSAPAAGPARGVADQADGLRPAHPHGQLAADLMGARICADTGEPGTFAWTQHLLGAPATTGRRHRQIQRNLIGERVLRLPPEPRADRVAVLPAHRRLSDDRAAAHPPPTTHPPSRRSDPMDLGLTGAKALVTRASRGIRSGRSHHPGQGGGDRPAAAPAGAGHHAPFAPVPSPPDPWGHSFVMGMGGGWWRCAAARSVAQSPVSGGERPPGRRAAPAAVSGTRSR